MTGIGAYYAWNENQPIDGLGAVQTPEPGLAEDALSRLVGGDLEMPGSVTLPPLAVVSPWASQEGDVDWQQESANWTLTLLPLSDALVQAAKAAAFGSPVRWFAVMTTKPATLQLAQAAFEATEYEFFAGEAVYNQKDPKAVPTPLYLYWAKLRDDASGGRSSLGAAAKALGGQLVFPVQSPLTGQERHPPSAPFATALAVQLQPSAAPAATPAVPRLTTSAPPQAASPAPPQAASAVSLGWLLALGAGGAAAWWLLRRRREAT